ncbi:MAG: TRAFs-binding domain-containing protein [Pseudomonadota bacterium]
MPEQKTCFVVMGFGEKTDYESQRTLDLDKSYRGIIKPAVEACGIKCVRADDIIHTGVIDRPMYQQLLGADLVIADLSTSNQNAIYELGVRHALRPNTTIVIAEKNFRFPFDLGHVVIRTYEHLGTGIDFEEVERVKRMLVEAIKETVLGNADVDSPVYTFLPDLGAPQIAGSAGADEPAAATTEAGVDHIVYGALLQQAQAAMESEQFDKARLLFERLLDINGSDAYATQQLALATYKRPQADDAGKRKALLDARGILAERLRPETTNDPETLGLWGAVHKRLWELDKQRDYLERAVRSYERGFYLKRDYYNGINYAFMLSVRATVQDDNDEAVADRVLANRVRKEVLDLVDEAEDALPLDAEGNPEDATEAYWVSATRLEALLGLGEHARLEAESAALFEKAPAAWMPGSTREQLEALRALL